MRSAPIRGKFREAMQPTLEGIKSVPVFSGPVPPGLADAFAAQQAQDLAKTASTTRRSIARGSCRR